MKTIATFLTIIALNTVCRAAGLVNFINTPATLISANGVAMPPRGEREFIFAIFLAPSSTVINSGLPASFTDPVFQLASGYNTNHSIGAGRLAIRLGVDVGTPAGYSAGDFVDFVVRGWSSNMGSTWPEALANWNNGFPLVQNWAIGSSTIGNDLFLGGGNIPTPSLFGPGSSQVGGFHLIPEPSCVALVGLGSLVWLKLQRRQS